VLLHKYYGGEVPECGALTEADETAFKDIRTAAAALTECLENFKFRDALKEAMNIARIGNKYLADAEPWKLIKTDAERVKTIMYVSTQICANLEVAFAPFLPFMAEDLGKMLHFTGYRWDMLGSNDLIPAGTKVEEPHILFEKIEDSVVEQQVQKLLDTKKQNEFNAWKPVEVKETVDFPTFEKMDIRVGKVLECKKVPKADKLLQFLIEDGMGTRTIVSGIAKYYKPEDLVGKDICFIANFAPRKLKGVESQGMILSAVNPDGSLVVIGPQGNVVPGAQVG
jgi:methionyl-tRNA synthetase